MCPFEGKPSSAILDVFPHNVKGFNLKVGFPGGRLNPSSCSRTSESSLPWMESLSVVGLQNRGEWAMTGMNTNYATETRIVLLQLS